MRRADQIGSNRTRVTPGVAVLAVAVVVLTAFAWTARRDDGPAIRTVQGWASVNDSGTAISLHPAPGEAGDGYIIAGARSIESSGQSTDGGVTPSCVGDDPSVMSQVELRVVDVIDTDGTGWTHVVSLTCLGPTITQ